MLGDFPPDRLSPSRARSGCVLPAETPDPIAAALGDQAVLRRLHAAAAAMLRSWHRHLSPRQRRAEAEEVVQEAARRALARRSAYDSERRVVPWLAGFVAVVCKERARGRGVDTPVDGHALEDLAVDLSRSAEETLADRLDSREILDRLPAGDQDLLRWRFFEDISALEIGRRLGISEAAARVRLFRVLARLKSEMAAEEGQP